MKALVIYCFDAYCNWCYGFNPVIRKIFSVYRNSFDFEVLSGGMIQPQKPLPISIMASFFLNNYKKVEAATGVIFGEDYLWHMRNPGDSDWYPNSEKSAIALCIFKSYYPEKQVEFAAELQYALHNEGRDLCDDESYRHLIIQHGIPELEFYHKLHSSVYKEMAYQEFELVKKLKVTGFPCTLLQISASKLYLLSNGYVDYDTLAQRIDTHINANDI